MGRDALLIQRAAGQVLDWTRAYILHHERTITKDMAALEKRLDEQESAIQAQGDLIRTLIEGQNSGGIHDVAGSNGQRFHRGEAIHR